MKQKLKNALTAALLAALAIPMSLVAFGFAWRR